MYLPPAQVMNITTQRMAIDKTVANIKSFIGTVDFLLPGSFGGDAGALSFVFNSLILLIPPIKVVDFFGFDKSYDVVFE